MIIKKDIINDIPLITYELDNNEEKPLLFFFHGFTGNKDELMGRGEVLANLGFYVVAIDAYLHGERMPDWFKAIPNEEKYQYIIDITIQTAKDAKDLWENVYKNSPKIKGDKFFTYGVSMGAMTSYGLSTITKDIKAMVTLVGSPSYVEYYKDRQTKYNWDDSVVLDRLEKYQSIDPLLNPNLVDENIKLFMALGSKDDVVYPKYSRKFYQVRNKNTILKEYDTGHMSTTEMLDDSYNFLKLFLW